MNNMACTNCGDWGRWQFGLCGKCQEMRLEIDRQLAKENMEHLRERLDYARDKLLVELAKGVDRLLGDQGDEARKLDLTIRIFEEDLEKVYPGKEQ